MTEQNIVDGLVLQLQSTNGFEAGNRGTAVADDHRVLSMGMDQAVIVLSDGFTQRRMVAGGLTEMTYSLEVELFVRHNNDIVAARQNARLYASNIVDRVNRNPTLGGSAFTALVTSGRIEDESFKIGQVPFLVTVLTVAAVEHLTDA